MNYEYTEISFPIVNWILNPGRAFNLGNFSIHIYGILIALGLMMAVVYAWKRCRQFGINEDDLTDGVLWIVPFAVICARLYYCIFQWDHYKDNPISILYIWNGGLAIYGGVIGAVIGIVIHCKFKKIKIAALLDLVALGFLIGQCVGRWGNFFNREAFGSETASFLRMGLYNTQTKAWEYHHPTFLYESVWNLVGFVTLHLLSKYRKYDGQVALGYAAWYGLGRAIIEALRTDSLYWGDFRVSQLLAAISCFVAFEVLIIMMFREHKPENLFVNQVAAKLAAEEAAAETEAAAATAEEATEETIEETAEEAEAVAEETIEE